MKWLWLQLSVGVGSILLAFVAEAPAEARCEPHAVMTRILAEKYNEMPAGLGIKNGSPGILEVWVSEKGSWSVLYTGVNGISCIVAAGHSWESIPVPTGEPT